MKSVGKMFLVLLVVMALVLTGCSSTQPAAPQGETPEPQQQAAFPTKAIEIYCPHSAGGGSDIYARTVANILTKHKIVNVPVTVTNKPGVAEGMRYMYEKKGDGHTLMTVTGGFITQSLVSDVGLKPSDFTILAQMATDPFIFLVRKDSEFKTFQDLVEFGKKNPGAIKVGVTSLGESEHCFVERIAEAAGVQVTVVPFQGGGEVTAALLGGHIHTTPGNPSENVGQIEAGEVRGLAINTDERHPKLPDVPTLAECGIPVKQKHFRGLIAPPDLPADQLAFWNDALSRVAETPDWAEYVEQNMLEPDYIGSEEFTKHMNELTPIFESILKRAGILK
ncbi:MAG: Bug family tripartite tricarboxylate transporter substrate binding protein [bacterium]|jgi:putative tricarboxylic transport membrane protein